MLFWKVVRAEEDPALMEGRAPAAFLSAAEEKTFAALRFEARQRKWLLGRWAAKRVLLEVLEKERGGAPDPTALTIDNAPSGAPFARLEGERLPWCLSISHRAQLGFAAVETDPALRVGADLELVAKRSGSLLRTFFTEAEQAEVAAAEQAQVAIARIWSAKEAVLKALGLGLRRDTRDIEVRLPAPGTPCSGLEDFELLKVRLKDDPPPDLTLGWRSEGTYVLTLARLRPSSPAAPDLD